MVIQFDQELGICVLFLVFFGGRGNLFLVWLYSQGTGVQEHVAVGGPKQILFSRSLLSKIQRQRNEG